MFTLSYSAAYDPYNTIFRMLCILSSANKKAMQFETLKYADFYLCFPWLLSELTASRSIPGFLARKNRIVRSYQPTKYDVLPSSWIMFDRMEPFQVAALSAMLDKGMVEREEDVINLVEIPNSGLSSTVNEYVSRNQDLLGLLPGLPPEKWSSVK